MRPFANYGNARLQITAFLGGCRAGFASHVSGAADLCSVLDKAGQPCSREETLVVLQKINRSMMRRELERKSKAKELLTGSRVACCLFLLLSCVYLVLRTRVLFMSFFHQSTIH